MIYPAIRCTLAILLALSLCACESKIRQAPEDILEVDPGFSKEGIIEMSIYPPTVPSEKGAPLRQSLRDAARAFLTQRRHYTVVAQSAVEKALAITPTPARDADALLQTDAVLELVVDSLDISELRSEEIAYVSGSVRVWRNQRELMSRRFKERKVLISHNAAHDTRPEAYHAIAKVLIRDILEPIPPKVFE